MRRAVAGRAVLGVADQMMPAPNQIILGHNLLVLRTWPDACMDSCVVDPPYGLKFMGKAWDADVPKAIIWKQVLRVLKPGGHLLSFFGTRTYHRGVCAIEDAGFEIRDQIGYCYGSGFPKSLDISRAIDKAAGAKRKVIGKDQYANRGAGINGATFKMANSTSAKRGDITAPSTDAAKQWSGWGTAIKPAWEPIVLARKPIKGTVAENVIKHGTGGLNVDGCRIGNDEMKCAKSDGTFKSANLAMACHNTGRVNAGIKTGRWPANLIHDGGPEVLDLFPGEGDKSAARFFYCPKASRTERDAGCTTMPRAVLARSCQAIAEAERGNVVEHEAGAFNQARLVYNDHATVKPLSLMRYLCRLITPPGGLVLDPFVGSGSTAIAAMQEGFQYLGIDSDSKSVEIAKARLAHWSTHND